MLDELKNKHAILYLHIYMYIYYEPAYIFSYLLELGKAAVVVKPREQ